MKCKVTALEKQLSYIQESDMVAEEDQAEIDGLKGTNKSLLAEVHALKEERDRLRATNEALCAQVFGDAADFNADAIRMLRGQKTVKTKGGTVAEDSMAMVVEL